jgi:hypothetical protein
MKSFAISLVSLLCVLTSFSFNEKDQLTTLVDRIEAFNNHYYENIYVHTNKEIFQPGDRLWFNAYVTGVAAKASKSTTLYCRIANASGKKILMKRFQIIDGLSGGDIELDKNLNNGNYRLTFFTKKSIVSENNFTKDILIKNYHSEFEVSRSEIQNENVDQKFTIESIVYIGNDSLHVEIPSQEDIVDEIFLIVTIRGEVFWASEETLKLNNKISLALSELPAGMVTITGFNKSEIIILRNTIAINNSKLSSIAIKLDKSSYGSGGKKSLDISVTNANGIPIPADLSVSVYVKELNMTSRSRSIVEYMAKSENLELCLSKPQLFNLKKKQSAIKGLVTRPEENSDAIHTLTIHKMEGIYYKEETDLLKKFSTKADSVFHTTELEGSENYKEDHISFILKEFHIKPDTCHGIVKSDLPTSRELINLLSDPVHLGNYLDRQFSVEEIELESGTESDSIGEVKLFRHIDEIEVEMIKSEEISVTAGQSFIHVLKQVTNFHGINSKMGEVYFNKGYYVNQTPLFIVNNMPIGNSTKYYNSPALFVLNNESIGHDYRLLDLVSSDLINEITIIKNLDTSMRFGIQSRGGVVIISTKDVILNLIKPAEPLINLSTTKSIKFYESHNKFEQSQGLESCAFWKDHVIVDHNGKANVEFNNLSLGGTMVIRVEGVDINRNFISYEMSYKVL